MNQLFDAPALREAGKQRYLFASLVLFLLMGPIFGPTDTLFNRLAMYLIMTMLLITGPLAASRSKPTLYVTVALSVGTLLLGVFSSVVEDVAYATTATLFGMLFFGYLAGLLIRNLLFRTQKVDSETLWAAVNVYMLLGLFFAFLYAAIGYADPEMFIGRLMNAPLRDQLYGFIYFSFVTLTTLGYGDLVPNNIAVGTMAYVEALIGQLYIAIMIARLVSLYGTSRG